MIFLAISLQDELKLQFSRNFECWLNNWPILAQNCLPSKISLLHCYEVLWTHDINTISRFYKAQILFCRKYSNYVLGWRNIAKFDRFHFIKFKSTKFTRANLWKNREFSIFYKVIHEWYLISFHRFSSISLCP